MIVTGFLLFFLQAEPPRAPPAGRGAPPQLQFRSRVVIRVPAIAPPPRIEQTRPAEPEWRESKGPRCVAAKALRGVALTRGNKLDMVLRDGTRVRAHLDSDCRALDFRSGIYLHPGGDGMICQDRDMIHTRAGAQCEIDRFRKLSLKR